jgi:hypothetical protein
MEITSTLELYGATLSPTGRVITPGGVETGVTLKTKGKRLRAEDANGRLIYSGPAAPESVCRFVEEFWYWRKS